MAIRTNEVMVVNARLTQIGLSFRVKCGSQFIRHAVFECECGDRRVMVHANVKSNKSKSCGCWNAEILGKCHIKHGKCRIAGRTAEYRTWCGIKDRCINENSKSFKYYGGRGITMCNRWKDSFPAFLEDMGERGSAESIDRIDNSKGYSKDNCRWATRAQQARNKRSNVMLTIHGETKSVIEWSEVVGSANQFTIYKRLRLGWTHPDAVFGKIK